MVRPAPARRSGGRPVSGTPGREKVGRITWEQVLEIAKQKMPDLNTTDLEAAARMIAGSARSMGVEVVGAPEVKDA